MYHHRHLIYLCFFFPFFFCLSYYYEYCAGDIGFDPLGLKPDTWEEFSEMSTKELQQGRLAMLAIAGIVAQELVNGKEIFVNWGSVPDTFDPSSLPFQLWGN